MFTVKFVLYNGNMHIRECEHVSVLRDNGGAEITLHGPGDQSHRGDVRSEGYADACESLTNRDYAIYPTVYREAFIENSMGRTTEVVRVPS